MARPKANRKDDERHWSRAIGDRSYRFRKAERLVERMSGEDGWELWEYADWSKDGWISLKVFDARQGAKRTPKRRVYQVGYSTAQGRMARNAQLAALDELYPDVSQWVRETAKIKFGKDGD